MTGPTDLRPALGWVRRRLAELPARALEPAEHDGVPLPPRRLRARVGAPDPREFAEGGAAVASLLLERAGAAGVPAPASVLDFGCGCGRVLISLARQLHGARLVGVDVDSQAVSWIREHLPQLDAHTSAAAPPLTLGPARFELIYSISVFSHLDGAAQDAWLAELADRLIPGGVALLSVHGPSALEAFASGRVSTAWCAPHSFSALPSLADAGFLTVPYRRSRWSASDLPGVGTGYGLSFHDPAYIREHWGTWLEIEEIIPRAVSDWQDLVIARPRR